MIESSSGALVGAAFWIETLLTGKISLVVAILGVASIGLAMLAGRISVRRATEVIVGCFVLFSAQAIAFGMRTSGSGLVAPTASAQEVVVPKYQASVPAFEQKDPYAGAAAPPPAENDWK